jgi:hypothetical protein
MRLADLIGDHNDWLYSGRLDDDQFRACRSILRCRTIESGGALYGCEDCGTHRFLYHSCGHRFCPGCQNHSNSRWLAGHVKKLLPAEHFMITFTLPQQLRNIPREKLSDFYDAFFECASASIKQLCGKRLSGECGMTGVLHTNSRKLAFHPHIHFVLPAVILRQDKQTFVRLQKKYFLNGHALSALFRGKFLAALKEKNIAFPKFLYSKKFNTDVSAKGNGKGVFQYLSRYLMRGVVSEKYLQRENGQVVLSYRDSKDQKMKSISFGEEAFLDLLIRHVLPRGFRRVRSYGFMAPAGKKMLHRLQLLMQASAPEIEEPPRPAVKCPCCEADMKLWEPFFSAEIVKCAYRHRGEKVHFPLPRAPPTAPRKRKLIRA